MLSDAPPSVAHAPSHSANQPPRHHQQPQSRSGSDEHANELSLAPKAPAKATNCRRFYPNVFTPTKCQECFRSKAAHSAEALAENRAARKICKCGYLFVAPADYDYSNAAHRNRRWQQRWFVLYDDGELTFAVDSNADTVAQGVVDMTRVTEVRDGSELSGHECSLLLRAPDHDYFLKANTKDEIRWWYDVLVMYPRSLRFTKQQRAQNQRRSRTLPNNALNDQQLKALRNEPEQPVVKPVEPVSVPVRSTMAPPPKPYRDPSRRISQPPGAVADNILSSSDDLMKKAVPRPEAAAGGALDVRRSEVHREIRQSALDYLESLKERTVSLPGGPVSQNKTEINPSVVKKAENFAVVADSFTDTDLSTDSEEVAHPVPTNPPPSAPLPTTPVTPTRFPFTGLSTQDMEDLKQLQRIMSKKSTSTGSVSSRSSSSSSAYASYKTPLPRTPTVPEKTAGTGRPRSPPVNRTALSKAKERSRVRPRSKSPPPPPVTGGRAGGEGHEGRIRSLREEYLGEMRGNAGGKSEMNRGRENSDERKQREDRDRKNAENLARLDSSLEQDRRRELEREEEAERRRRMREDADKRMTQAEWYRHQEEVERERQRFEAYSREVQKQKEVEKAMMQNRGTPARKNEPVSPEMQNEEYQDRDIMPEIRPYVQPVRKPRVEALRPGESTPYPDFMQRNRNPNRMQSVANPQQQVMQSSYQTVNRTNLPTQQQAIQHQPAVQSQPVMQRNQNSGQNMRNQEPVMMQHMPNRWIPSVPGNLPNNPHIGFNIKLPMEKYSAVIGDLNRMAESLNRITLADLNGPEAEQRKAERYTCLDIRTFLEKLQKSATEDNKRFVTYPHPLATSVSPQYIQSWHYDAFGSSAWIMYEAKDQTTRWENRYGQVFKFVGGRFRRVEEYPKYFNPNRFFPDDISFWRGDNLWDGSYNDRSRQYVQDMYRKLDEQRIQWYGSEGENRMQRAAAIDFWSAGHYVHSERDVREIDRIVKTQLSDFEQRNLSTEMVRAGDQNELARLQMENDRMQEKLKRMQEDMEKEQEERLKLERRIKERDGEKQSEEEGSLEGNSDSKDGK